MKFHRDVIFLAHFILAASYCPAQAVPDRAIATPPPASVQESKPADVRELKRGALIERELTGGEAHSYSVMLTAGQYLNVVVKQKGIDVVVKILGPDGQKLTEVDNNPLAGTESAFVIAEASGEYRLAVQSYDKDARSGTYDIKIEELREGTPKDRVQVAAESAFEEASRLRDQRTAESRRMAIKKYEEALPLWRKAGDKRGEAFTVNEIGVLYSRFGEPQKALEYYDQAVPLWQDLGDPLNEAFTLNNAGVAYGRLGDFQKALEYHRQALPLARVAGGGQVEAVVLSNFGLAYLSLGQPQEALRYYSQALPLARAAGDRRQQGVILNTTGTVYLQLGELQKALEYLTQVLPLRRAAGDRIGESTTLHNIGRVYQDLGDLKKALDFLNQALTLTRAVGDPQNEAITLQTLTGVYRRLGDLQSARECADKALALSRAVGDRRLESYELNALGAIYQDLGETEKARDNFDQALSLARAVEDKLSEISILNNIGASYTTGSDPRKALEYHRQALQLSRGIRSQFGETSTLFRIARAQDRLGDLIQARTQIEAALEIIESTRTKVTNQQLRASFLASKQEFYQFYIDLLMRLNRSQPSARFDAAGIEASERARARGLLDILTEARADIRQGLDAVLLEREHSTQQQLNAKSERLTRLLSGKHTEEQEMAARKEVETLLTDYQDVEAQIRAKSPRYAGLTQPEPLSLKEIQQLLDGETMLLEYALGEERSYLWAVTPTSVTSFELPKRADIEAAATLVYEALTARNKFVRFEKQENKQARVAKADAEYFAASAFLSQMLLGPAAGRLERKRLLIVSDGALQYVPFGALPIPGDHLLGSKKHISNYRPLITEHEIVSLPSASTLAILRKELVGRQRAAKTIAVLADPVFQDDDPRVRKDSTRTDKQVNESSLQSAETRGLESEMERSARDTGEVEFRRLPFSRQEAEGIAALTSNAMRKELLDFEANRVTFTSADLSNYRIVHFATHGLLDSQHPELSGIVLSLVDEAGRPQDGFLRLNEIYNLKLGADLVVLSACRTALGKEIKGEGLVGLTRGFMYAGAPRVVASLWAVDDEITAELMKRFYREMLVKKQRPAAALRAAQVSIWKEKGLPPYYWAAFVLQGEWK